MLDKLRSSLTYANVMATAAVFVALGGTSYAVATGSIDSRELKNNTVRSKDLRNNDVRGKDIRNGTIGSRDVNDGALLAEDFKAGQLPAGERGPQGEQGPPGQDATKLFAYIRDGGSVDTATVHYGSGVTAVSDPAGNNAYTVTFNRSLVNCVVQAVAGHGDPPGSSTSFNAIPIVLMTFGGANGVDVAFNTDAGAATDTAFLITAFC